MGRYLQQLLEEHSCSPECVKTARTSNDQETLKKLLPHHPSEVLGNKHFTGWGTVRDMLTQGH